MKRLLAFLLIFGMVSSFTLTGCEEKVQAKPEEKTPPPSTQVGKIDKPETGDNLPATIPASEVKLDKTYFNKRFEFEVKYPSIWSLVEEEDNRSFPDQGAYIFIGNNKESSIDYNNINKIDHITVFGQVSPIAIPEAGMTIGEFVIGDGTKAKTYFENVDGMLNTYYLLEGADGNAYYGARVCVSEDTDAKYKEVISEIVKSIKVLKNK